MRYMVNGVFEAGIGMSFEAKLAHNWQAPASSGLPRMDTGINKSIQFDPDMD